MSKVYVFDREKILRAVVHYEVPAEGPQQALDQLKRDPAKFFLWVTEGEEEVLEDPDYRLIEVTEEADPNLDPIPGVILLNNLDDGVVEDLFALPSPEMDEAIHAEAGRLLKELGWEKADSSKYDAIMQEIYESMEEIDFPKEGEVDGVKVKLFGLGGAWHVMVLNSPCTTNASACSPCVPGAADLDSCHEHGLLCYDVPSSWRRKESQEN